MKETGGGGGWRARLKVSIQMSPISGCGEVCEPDGGCVDPTNTWAGAPVDTSVETTYSYCGWVWSAGARSACGWTLSAKKESPSSLLRY